MTAPRKQLLLHSMFRAGSTYLFSKLRALPRYYCYYEPLHHELVRLRRDNIELWGYDRQSTNYMKHPELGAPHFQEYLRAFRDGYDVLPCFEPGLSYDDFSGARENRGLRCYIENLRDSAPQVCMPVLQFNRTTLRVGWFRRNFPDAYNVFLLRSPRDQFDSYVNVMGRKDSIFLAMNLYILARNEDLHFTGVAGCLPAGLSGKDVIADLAICAEHANRVSLPQHYLVFYYLWVMSLLEARAQADRIVDMDRLSCDPDYARGVAADLQAFGGGDPLDFTDAALTKRARHCMADATCRRVESRVLENCKRMVSAADIESISAQVSSYGYPRGATLLDSLRSLRDRLAG